MTPVEQLVAAFGGIRPMASKLGEKHASLVQGWKEAGSIPHYRRAQIVLAAQQHGIELPGHLVAALFPSHDETA